MEITVSKDYGDIQIKITGPIAPDLNSTLGAELKKILDMNPSSVVLNLSDVPNITSSGIGKLLAFYKGLNKIKSSFRIQGVHENILTVFKSTKLDTIFDIDLAEA